MVYTHRAIVLKTTGPSFTILPDDSHEKLSAVARGRLKIDGNIYPGDRVLFSQEGQNYIIGRVLPRKNLLYRPKVANVDELVIVVSLKKPKIDYYFLDKTISLAEWFGIPTIICLNKLDLDGEIAQDAKNLYSNIGYRVIMTSALENMGIEELQGAISQKVAVLAGPSGVGKSTILNLFDSSWELATAEISHRLKRGRHTTKHVELFPWKKGLITDTPGFSRLSISKIITPEGLAGTFREFAEPSQKCRFDTCRHYKEPDCGVKDAVKSGQITSNRYENYIKFLEEIDKYG